MPDFDKIAPYLKNELVLAGFVTFLVVGLLRLLLSLNIFKKLTTDLTYSLLMRVITYGFILGLFGLMGGFWLAAYRISVQVENIVGIDPPKPLIKPKRVDPIRKNNISPQVNRIIEGYSNSTQSRLFNVSIANPLEKQVILDAWEMKWKYLPGMLASMATASVIQPVNTHIVEIKIDTNNYNYIKRSIPIEDDIILPAASKVSPSIYKFRLEVFYIFSSPDMKHSGSDWNIEFSMAIRTTDGDQIPVFFEQLWRT